MKCPCCNGKRVTVVSGQVYKCGRCKTIFGECYKGDFYNYVFPSFETSIPETTYNKVYFDFNVLGSTGIERIHGWMNKDTKRVYQFG